MKMMRAVSWIAAAAMVISLSGPEALAAAGGNANRDSKGKPAQVEEKQKAEAAADEQVDEAAPAEEETEGTEPAKGNQGMGQVKDKNKDNTKVEAEGDELTDEAAAESEEDELTNEEQAEQKAKKEKRVKELKEETIKAAREEREKGATGPYLVYVNGERLNLTPLAHNGRTLVPFRSLGEHLGATVSWEPSTRTVTMALYDDTVQFTIGAMTALVNGEEVELEVPAEIQNDLTYVPVRFLAETLGAHVDYDPETGAVTVITPEDAVGDDEATADDETADDETADDDEATADDETADDETTTTEVNN